MGYVLLLVIMLSWREIRKIRKALFDIAYENGKPPTNFTRLVDLLEKVFNQRQDEKKKKKSSSE